jgi:hypothetical protein
VPALLNFKRVGIGEHLGHFKDLEISKYKRFFSPSYAHLRQDFFEKIKSILGEVNQKVFNKRQMIALLNSNSPQLLNIIVNFMNKCMSKRNSS